MGRGTSQAAAQWGTGARMVLQNYPESDEDASVDQSLEVGHPEETSDFSEGSSAADTSSRGQGWKALCQQPGNRPVSEGIPGGIGVHNA